MNNRELLLQSFQAALAAADPLKIVPAHLPAPPKGKTLIVGAGKAAASMAKAVEDNWPADKPLEGLVITRYGHSLPTKKIRVIEAGHPVPDESGEQAAKEIFNAVKSLGENDLLLALISGGGSSLMSLPVAGVSMADLKTVTKDLLNCGATIQEINTIRKHLSLIQGGQLAAASKAPVCALLISDVTGDEPTFIASGPCAPDPTTYADAIDVLARYKIIAPTNVQYHLTKGTRGDIAETPKPGDKIFARVENKVIATAQQSLQAAANFFQAQNITPVILGDSVTGEARDVAKVYAALAKQIRQHQSPFKAPVALISGGETTVTMRGNGRGGRNTEYLLSLAIELDGMGNVFALACDTDGIDGSEPNAGALLMPDSLARSKALNIQSKQLLANNDAYGFFSALDDVIVTGPTRTNVNDFRVILVL
ncbi:MAG: putative hydroxypyruvate reductase [Pseudomonadota bacterium]|jgi:glycerate 2-kinase